MKKIKFIMAAVMLLIGATTMQAQSLGDILGGIGKAIIGDKATTEEGIKGQACMVHGSGRCELSRATTFWLKPAEQLLQQRSRASCRPS